MPCEIIARVDACQATGLLGGNPPSPGTGPPYRLPDHFHKSFIASSRTSPKRRRLLDPLNGMQHIPSAHARRNEAQIDARYIDNFDFPPNVIPDETLQNHAGTIANLPIQATECLEEAEHFRRLPDPEFRTPLKERSRERFTSPLIPLNAQSRTHFHTRFRIFLSRCGLSAISKLGFEVSPARRKVPKFPSRLKLPADENSPYATPTR